MTTAVQNNSNHNHNNSSIDHDDDYDDSNPRPTFNCKHHRSRSWELKVWVFVAIPLIFMKPYKFDEHFNTFTMITRF